MKGKRFEGREINLSPGLPGPISLSIMNGWAYESLLILEMG